MIFPVRCFTCGSVVGNKWNEFEKHVQAIEPTNDPVRSHLGNVLDEMNVTRYCCRRMFLGHVELIDRFLAYHDNDREKSESSATLGNPSPAVGDH